MHQQSQKWVSVCLHWKGCRRLTVNLVYNNLWLTCLGGHNTGDFSAVGYHVLWWGVIPWCPFDLTTEIIAHFIRSFCRNIPVYGNCSTVDILTNDLHLVQWHIHQFTIIIKHEGEKFTRGVWQLVGECCDSFYSRDCVTRPMNQLRPAQNTYIDTQKPFSVTFLANMRS